MVSGCRCRLQLRLPVEDGSSSARAGSASNASRHPGPGSPPAARSGRCPSRHRSSGGGPGLSLATSQPRFPCARPRHGSEAPLPPASAPRAAGCGPTQGSPQSHRSVHCCRASTRAMNSSERAFCARWASRPALIAAASKTPVSSAPSVTRALVPDLPSQPWRKQSAEPYIATFSVPLAPPERSGQPGRTGSPPGSTPGCPRR